VRFIFIALMGCLTAFGSTEIGVFNVTNTCAVSDINWADYLEQRTMPVVVLLGQSNASGRGSGLNTDYWDNTMPAYIKNAQSNVLFWTIASGDGSSEIYLQPMTVYLWGVELQMGYEISQAHDGKLAIIKCAAGSTALGAEWIGEPREGKFDMQIRSIDWINAGLSDISDLGYIPDVQMVVWIQGEDDSVNEAWATNYYSNFVYMWTNLCANTGIDTNTVIGLSPLAAAYGSTYKDNVNAAFDSLTNNYSSMYQILTDDTSYNDGVHYTPESLNLLGSRFATNYLSRFSQAPLGKPKISGTFSFQESN
jgi:hypothetical protein